MPGLRKQTVIIEAASRLVILSEGVLATLAAHAGSDKESGGIFIGCYRGPHLEIVSCTTPLAGDIRRTNQFDRRDPGHQAFALRAWSASGRTETFVGEWHTHPEDDPSPSQQDLTTWRSILRVNPGPLLFLIVGRHSLWCGIGCGALVERAYVGM